MNLKSGKIKCDKCNGNGITYRRPKYKTESLDQYYYNASIGCDKCNGLGKLDWVENIVGKRKSNLNMSGVTTF